MTVRNGSHLFHLGKRAGLHYSNFSTAAYRLMPIGGPSYLKICRFLPRVEKDGLKAFGFADTVSGRKGFVERLERRLLAEGLEKAGIPTVGAEMDKRLSNSERGWYWGSQAFGEKMLKIGERVLKKPRCAGDRSAKEL
jgi:hypothetical protein